MSSAIEQIRRFNRSYTSKIGVLDDHFLGRERPLGPTRTLWEIGLDGIAISDLRAKLGLDSGYLSRLLQTLESDGLVAITVDPADRRRRRANLTKAGKSEWQTIEQAAQTQAAELIDKLSPSHQAALADALATAEKLLNATAIELVVTDPESPEALSALSNYFTELDQRFVGGFTITDELSAEAAGYRPPTGLFVVALYEGETVGCGGVQRMDDGAVEIKRMWVHEDWRGVGLGRRVLSELEGHAAKLGNGLIRLDTNRVLAPAIAMYRSAGYRQIERYSDNPYAHLWFEKGSVRRL